MIVALWSHAELATDTLAEDPAAGEE